jgi:phenylpropionate dioxygenase-like ring-hydroxylating dioxygenase large terminal subunit
MSGVVTKRPAAIDAGLQLGLRNRWYPIFESRDLGSGKAIGIRRLGEDLALWRDADGRPHLFIDRCPHRGAAFSEGGTVHGQELQCWYHGFRYDGGGQCTAVPVEGEQTALASRVSITSYPVEERWGMIWAFIGEVDLFPPPPLELPYEMTAADWAGHIARATWRANWLLVIDNLIDPMHASWLHAKSYTLSKGKKSARLRVRDLEDGFIVERENQRGVNFDWTEYHDNGSLWFRLEIPYPRSAGPGGPFRILGWSTPVDAETSLNYFLRMRHVSGWQRQVWDLLYGLYLERNHWNVLEQDRLILESQRGLSSRLWEHMAQTDIGVVRLRRMLNEAYWRQQEVYLAAAAAGRKPSSGERVKALLAARGAGSPPIGREAIPV